MPEGAQKCLLRKILCGLAGKSQHAEKAEHAPLMTQYQQAKGVLLPGERLAYEEGVLHRRPSTYTDARPEGSLPACC
jgi:hypothetical protein